MLRKILWVLLIMVYGVLALFGFLTGMFSEGLISSTYPMADFLADVMIWLGLIISLAAVLCPLMSLQMKEKPVQRRIVLAIPFFLLAVQMLLSGIADML